jgi:excisionase family DNA binding protein
MKEYTIKQAAEILEVSTSTVRRRIKSKELKAEKKESPYGKQYFIPASELDRAVMDNESVNISQVNKPVDKEEFINALTEATEGKYKALFEGIADSITNKIDQQNKEIRQYKDQLEQQNDLIREMKEELKEIKDKQNKTIIESIKKILFGKES